MSIIFGIRFSDKTQKQTTNYISNSIDIDSKGLAHIVTANPEIVMKAQKSKGFMKMIRNADLVTADGIGVVWASKMFGLDIPERVTGYDTIVSLFEERQKEQKPMRVYLVGAKPDVVKKAAQHIENKYSYIQVVGYHDGFFKTDDEHKIIREINQCNADLLLVAMGSPRQEQFIFNNKTKLKIKVAIGVGGVFDVLSGNVKRAPEIFQKTNLEWFYRLISSPSRMFRQMSLLRFAFKVLFATIGLGKK